MSSAGTRESEQPSTMANGCCPAPGLPPGAAPCSTNRRFPSRRRASASRAEIIDRLEPHSRPETHRPRGDARAHPTVVAADEPRYGIDLGLNARHAPITQHIESIDYQHDFRPPPWEAPLQMQIQ